MEPDIITDSGETDEAATETPPAAEDTEQPKDTFEPDELRELMRGVVQEENGKFWAAVEQSTGRHIGALRTQLEEVMGNSRRTDAMVQRMFDGQMTDADRADLDAAMGLEAEKEKLAKTGNEPVVSSPEEFTAFMRAEIGKWAKVVKESKLRID